MITFKNWLNISFTLIFASILFFSCAKKTSSPSSSNNNNTSPTQSLSATIDGNSWTATSDTGYNSSGIITVEGFNGQSSLILELTSSSPGTYQLNSSSQTSIQYSPDGFGSFYSSSGTIVIGSYSNNYMTGTFQGSLSGSGPNVFTVVNGKFTAKIY